MGATPSPAVGIDLGTTFSVVAHLDATGRPCTIPNSEGDPLTPSVVLFDGSSLIVGKEAVKAAAMEPDRVADFAKREMGNAHYSRTIGGERLPPEVIQSLILEKLKRTLTARDQATIAFEHVGQGLRVPLARSQFEALTADLLQRTHFTVRSVLKDAGVEWKEITRLLRVVGSTRMPMVQQMLEQESGTKVDRSVSADEAVAHGAAIYAGLLQSVRSGARPTMKVRNVNSHDLGVLAKEPGTGRPRNSIIIPRNSVLPVTKGKRFKTHGPNQPSVAIHVIEGSDATGKNCTPIGTCILGDLPSGLPAGTPVEVFFTYAENGRLTVRGQLLSLNRDATLTIDRASGLSDTNLEEWDRRLRRPEGLLNLD